MATTDIDPCRGTNQLENEKFAKNENDKVAVRTTDEETHRLLGGIVGAELKDPEHFNGEVMDGDPYIDVPAVADTDIVNILIHNLEDNDNETLLVSFDGGANYKSVFAGDRFIWTMGTGSSLKQIKIRAEDKDVKYEIVMNREAV